MAYCAVLCCAALVRYLDGVLVGKDVDELEGVLDDAARHQLLSTVSSVLHEGTSQSLHDRAL